MPGHLVGLGVLGLCCLAAAIFLLGRSVVRATAELLRKWG